MNHYNPRQYVELFHLLFLDQLSRKLDPKLYALKGGANLRFFCHSARYSEDVDLDIQIIQKDTLRNKIHNILHSVPFKQIMQIKGLEIINVTEPKRTETTQRWKITLKIATSEILLHTKIEFSRRGLESEIQLGPIDPTIIQQHQLSPIMINHYSVNTLFQQKIRALAGRSLTQARDIFDLHTLSVSHMPKLSINKKIQSCINKAKKNVISVSFHDYKAQVLSYLPLEYQQQFDSETMWDNIVLNVVETLEKVKL